MIFPELPTIDEIHRRLDLVFPAGLEMRQNLVREMAAKSVFVFLYGGMIEGNDRYLRPSYIYFFTKDQATRTSNAERSEWLASANKPGFRPEGTRWYADTTREPIRDETLRYGLLDIGAAGKLEGVAVTSSKPIYYLKKDFAALLVPGLSGELLSSAISAWQAKHLSPAARARVKLLSSGRVRRADEVIVSCPDGTSAKLSPGPSSIITKEVVEIFTANFLKQPALLWLSESGEKIRYQDAETANSIGLRIDQSLVLPDVIFVDVGSTGEDTTLVFIEVVASDGPMNQTRRRDLIQYVQDSGFPTDQCLFGTAFEDRADAAFKKCLPQLAWGTFVWFRTEPASILWMYGHPFTITDGIKKPW